MYFNASHVQDGCRVVYRVRVGVACESREREIELVGDTPLVARYTLLHFSDVSCHPTRPSCLDVSRGCLRQPHQEHATDSRHAPSIRPLRATSLQGWRPQTLCSLMTIAVASGSSADEEQRERHAERAAREGDAH